MYYTVKLDIITLKLQEQHLFKAVSNLISYNASPIANLALQLCLFMHILCLPPEY